MREQDLCNITNQLIALCDRCNLLAVIIFLFLHSLHHKTKSSMVPIRCNNLDLDHITQNLPATRASFPLRYLGLPLSVWKLRLVDLQFLVDKVASKLKTYEGQNITTIGRTALVKSVLTSQVIYFITPLIIPPSILFKVNQLERSFLWSGSDKTTGRNARCIGKLSVGQSSMGGLGYST